jgi:pimeloyl-ACP methyl ester carboxylesterase
MTLPATSELMRPDGTVLRYCLYGPADGYPVISLGGSPSTRWRRPSELPQQGSLLRLVYDRPGYGGSTRRPGRTVADAAGDVRALADAQGWSTFAIFGGSGGGPHALACAALLADRVTRCAVLSGIRPSEPGAPPRDEPELRSRLAGVSADIMGRIEAGGPEWPTEPGNRALDDPDAMARLRATFVDGMDGWVDDSIAFAQPWGFDPAAITAPVGIWYGTGDTNVSAVHAEYLLAHIPTAHGYEYSGGHVPGAEVFRDIYDWLHIAS